MYENNERNNTVESKLLYWDISNGTIIDNDNICSKQKRLNKIQSEV